MIHEPTVTGAVTQLIAALIARREKAFAASDHDTVFEMDEELRAIGAEGEWMDIGDEPVTPNNDEG